MQKAEFVENLVAAEGGDPSNHPLNQIRRFLRLGLREASVVPWATADFFARSEKHFQEGSAEPQVPPLRSPEFPVKLLGVGNPHAPFSTERRIHGRCEFCVAGNPGTLAGNGASLLS